ncbi:NAD(P)H-binding protein [Plantactinospora sp. B6F1]|uniref:NAD(P)-dependent oxidoreductase n=1 Tax=Plantactinospora sp. B6F1 TaxID=3158971 RepID=UPI0032D98A51
MKIAIIGATGMAGSRIAVEAARRGHIDSGYSRSEASAGRTAPGITLSTADATDPEAMGRIAAEHDVIVLATRPAPGTREDATSPVTVVLDAALGAGRRVIVIGGAGPLRCPDRPDQLVIDDQRFVPEQWRSIAQASVDQFNACGAHDADWTYLSPPALLGSGTRTGSYRRGGNQLLIDVNGESRISAEDLAVAAVDEIENPQLGTRHFTVAY